MAKPLALTSASRRASAPTSPSRPGCAARAEAAGLLPARRSRLLCADRAKALGLDVPLAEVSAEEAAPTFADALPVVATGHAGTAQPGQPDDSSAPAAIASIRQAVADVLAGRAAAVVTNPIAKNVLYRAGFRHPGHTEFLAELAAERRPARRIR